MAAAACAATGQDCKAVHAPCIAICKMGPIWPPSTNGSAAMVVAFMMLTVAVTVFLFVRHNRRSFDFGWDFPRQDAWGTSCRWIHPVVLLFFRLGALGLGGWQVETLLYANPTVFCFYTLWNFSLLTLYFAVATTVSIVHLPAAFSRHRHDGDGAAPLIGQKLSAERLTSTAGYGGFLERLQLLIFEIELPSAMLVTLVFWTVLAPQVIAAADVACTEKQWEDHNKTAACTESPFACTNSDCVQAKHDAAEKAVYDNDGNLGEPYALHKPRMLYVYQQE
jgi:cbb3-type cytochrome oxidase subunit 3